jgi:glutathione S-transferase
LQWLFWLANTLHPTLRMMFYPTQYTDGDVPAFRRVIHRNLCQKLTLLNDAPYADWLDADAPSIMGCYLAPLLRWCMLYGKAFDPSDLQQWARLHAFARRIEARPATQRAAIAEGLGPTPFSIPHPCDPPEGSAI